ncbi:hypothetical protein B484DRAFT_454373 [Ochromonadaceae sp. CCMP2298]|nr:hypothetical protein B484DRAFT_454373 [Ochromonadaceae sp. CCMP2298]
MSACAQAWHNLRVRGKVDQPQTGSLHTQQSTAQHSKAQHSTPHHPRYCSSRSGSNLPSCSCAIQTAQPDLTTRLTSQPCG